jgi:hypothetical protein
MGGDTTMEDAVAHKAQNENQKSSQDPKKQMKGNLGQQDAMRERESDSDMSHMGERSKDKKEH